ncbi:MAG: sugar transferase [Candidatus Diapherotrites archaeon]|nr:sugar transferase [Candidatus Diapherotrites archaeon]
MVRLLKRFFDFSVSLVSLVFLLPAFAVIGMAIKLDSHGKVFFVQERLGFGGKKFSCIKFRTMVEGAEDEGPRLSKWNDPRQTRTGRLLRRYYLDELPQLWNILLGEMSFVGPRPERPFFHRRFARKLSGWKKRLEAKPGLTGLAQAKGVSSTKPKEKLALDLLYLEKRSFLFDLKIIFAQFSVLFGRLGRRLKRRFRRLKESK